jgi:hypothetical protein
MIGDTYFGKAWMPDFATRGAGKPGRTPPQRMAPLPDSNHVRKPSKPSQTAARKLCSSCRRILPLSAFGLDRTRRDGRQHHCRPCRLGADSVRRERRLANGKVGA